MTGCGAILTQGDRPVAYFSAKFSPAEINYTTTEQELCGVYKALKEWRCYLEGCIQLTIVTDHNPLLSLPTQLLLSRRQARWMEFFSRFKFTWKHTPGVKNPADPLSRLHVLLIKTCAVVAAYELEPNLVNRIPNRYQDDPRFSNRQFASKLSWRGGFWFDRLNRIAVPSTMVSDVIKAHHANLHSGHFGVDRTVETKD